MWYNRHSVEKLASPQLCELHFSQPQQKTSQLQPFWGFVCLLACLFWPHHTACGILAPQPGIEPATPLVELTTGPQGSPCSPFAGCDLAPWTQMTVAKKQLTQTRSIAVPFPGMGTKRKKRLSSFQEARPKTHKLRGYGVSMFHGTTGAEKQRMKVGRLAEKISKNEA